MPIAAPILAGRGILRPRRRHRSAQDRLAIRLFNRRRPARFPRRRPARAAREWSGQSGASGHPLMTAEAIRAAAADFGNCVARLWPLTRRGAASRARASSSYTAGLTPDLQIMDLLDAQPEFTKSTWDYLDRWSATSASRAGAKCWRNMRTTFAAVERAYGVDRHIIAAIWGVESNYGTHGRRPPGDPLHRDARLRRPPPRLSSARNFSRRWKSCSAATSSPSG